MILNFDIYEFVRGQLPSHKRQTNRINLFNWGVSQLNAVWNTFSTWREDIIYQSRITGQKLALIDYLNKKVSGSNNQITIIEKNDGGAFLSKESEDLDFMWLSTAAAGTDLKEIPRYGEELTALDVDFQVIAPATANPDEINKILMAYLIAGKEYEIITI